MTTLSLLGQCCKYFNPYQNDKFLYRTKLKAFVKGKLNVAKTVMSLFDRLENTAGKEENGHQGHQNLGLCGKGVNCLPNDKI